MPQIPFLRLVLCGIVCLHAAGMACGEAAPLKVTDREALKPVLGPGDLVEVRVYGEDDLSGKVQLDEDGAVRLPLVGRVQINGLTADEASARIAEAYNARFLRDAQVSVLVKQQTSRQVFVLGQVKKPGAYPFVQNMTVIGAIARAGGVLRLGDKARTLITRNRADGQQDKFTVNLADISRGRSSDVELQPGDIIFVPETLL